MSQLEDTEIPLDERKNYSKTKTPKGRKENKMKDDLQTLPPVLVRGKKYAKSRSEHRKDVIIAILVSGIILFVAGYLFASSQQAEVDAARAEVTKSVPAEAPVKK